MSPLTGVLTEAWDLYRRFAAHFLLISFVIYLITAVLVALLSLAGVAGAIIGAVISFAATYVVQASLIKAVQDIRDGRADLNFSETLRAAGPYILPVIGASIDGRVKDASAKGNAVARPIRATAATIQARCGRRRVLGGVSGIVAVTRISWCMTCSAGEWPESQYVK